MERPTVGSILVRGLPGILREGFLPVGAFYIGWKASGLVVGMAAAAALALTVYAFERRAGRDGLLVRLSLGVVAFLTGTPTMILLLVWSIWFAIRRFSEVDSAEPERDEVPMTHAPSAPAAGSSLR